jgi:hypothetical protein
MVIAGTLVTGELGPVVTLIHEDEHKFSTESIDFQSDESAVSYWNLNFHERVVFHDEGAIYIGSNPSSVGMDVGDDGAILKVDFDNGDDHTSMCVVANSEFVVRAGWPLLQAFLINKVIVDLGFDVQRSAATIDI